MLSFISKLRLSSSFFALSVLLAACSYQDDEALTGGVPVPYEQMKAVSVSSDMGNLIKSGEIDIYEAYARAIKANLPERFDKMYKIMKQDLSQIEDYTLLPRIVALSGYNVRYSPDWNGLMFSGRLTGEMGDVMDVASSSLGAAVNVLDFSIVYSSAKNLKDNEKLSAALKKILIKNIIHDTRIAFLKAAAGQRIKKEVDKIASELAEALTYIKAVEDAPEFKGKIDGYKQNLMDNLSQINSLRREISASKVRLAGLISVDPDSEFIMLIPKDMDNPYIYKNLKLNNMENFALNTREEVKDDDNTTINPAEVRAEVKRLFPMVEMGLGLDDIKGDYLLNQMWSEIGIKTGWNLLHMASVDTPIGVSEIEMAKARSMATKVAVLAGVDMAYRNLEQAYQEYRIASLLDDISRNVYQKSDATLKGSNRFDVIGRNIEWLYSRLKKDYAYVNVKNAESSLHVALGVENTPPITMSSSVASIARSIEERLVPTEYADKEYNEIMDIRSAETYKQDTVKPDDAEIKRKVDEWLNGNLQENAKTVKKIEKKAEPQRVVTKKGVKVSSSKQSSSKKIAKRPSKPASLQLGSYSRPESAEKAWNAVFSKLKPLNGYQYKIKDVHVKGKDYYRLMVEGEKDELAVICRQIQSTVRSCIIK